MNTTRRARSRRPRGWDGPLGGAARRPEGDGIGEEGPVQEQSRRHAREPIFVVGRDLRREPYAAGAVQLDGHDRRRPHREALVQLAPGPRSADRPELVDLGAPSDLAGEGPIVSTALAIGRLDLDALPAAGAAARKGSAARGLFDHVAVAEVRGAVAVEPKAKAAPNRLGDAIARPVTLALHPRDPSVPELERLVDDEPGHHGATAHLDGSDVGRGDGLFHQRRRPGTAHGQRRQTDRRARENVRERSVHAPG